MNKVLVNRIGFWSAFFTFIFSLCFILAGIFGMMGLLSKHISNILVFAPSLLLAMSFVVMMTAAHYTVSDEKKIWSHIGLVFAVLYAAMVSIVYIVLLFVVEPNLVKGSPAIVASFVFEQGSFTQIIDGLGYTFMSIATLFAAPAFRGDRNGTWVFRFFTWNGIMALPIFISYITFNTFLGVPWIFTMLGSSLALTRYYMKGITVIHTELKSKVNI